MKKLVGMGPLMVFNSCYHPRWYLGTYMTQFSSIYWILDRHFFIISRASISRDLWQVWEYQGFFLDPENFKSQGNWAFFQKTEKLVYFSHHPENCTNMYFHLQNQTESYPIKNRNFSFPKFQKCFKILAHLLFNKNFELLQISIYP